VIIISDNDSIKVKVENLDLQKFINNYGIDIGYTLTKIAYIEKSWIILREFSTNNDLKKMIKQINEIIKENSSLNFTGGLGYEVFNFFSKSHKSILIDEFKANIKGAEILYFLEKKKSFPSKAIIASLGTGTSFTLIKNNEFKRLIGTALGGGFLLGLSKLLVGLSDFQEIIQIVNEGDRFNIDLKVADIYHKDDIRISPQFRELNAASFGKIIKHYDIKNIRKEDILQSILCVLGENIGTIACLNAELEDTKYIAFIGGLLENNKILKRILKMICIFYQKTPIFFINTKFAGALGALTISKEN